MHAFSRRLITAIQLTRLTMAFGAVSDLWLVILLTRAPDGAAGDIPAATLPLAAALALGAVIAVGLFAYGASLNDVLDARHDSAFSPQRPIPAGRIRPGQAIVIAVGSLLVAIIAAQAFGTWSLLLTLLTAVGILFYNAAGRFIPAVGIVAIGLIHAVHMVIPNPHLEFTWPVWFVMTHATAAAFGAYVLEGKRPRISRAARVSIVAGWIFWSGAILTWGIARAGAWPQGVPIGNIMWPLLAAAAFAALTRWKVSAAAGAAAAEKLRRSAAIWHIVYASTWLLALGRYAPALWMGAFAVGGCLAMFVITEILGQMQRPLAYRE